MDKFRFRIMLSKLLRFRVTDEKGESAKLTDLSVALLDSDYPTVNHIFLHTSDKKLARLPWEAVQSIDRKNKQIKVADLKAAEETSLEPTRDYVFLKGQILDALVLDLQNRRGVRANDLELVKTEEAQMELRAVDASINAIMRRISFGFYNYVAKNGLYDWKYVEFLRGNPQAVRNGAGYHLRITRLSPGEIAQLTNYIPYLHAAELLTLLPDPLAVKTLEIMPVERQLQVFEELEEEQAARLLALMAPDAAADLVGRLQTGAMKKYLKKIPGARSQKIIELLRYPEDTVGGIMTNDVILLPADLTVADARERLRERFKNTDFIYFIYVVNDDDEQILRGMISLRDLLISGDDEKLEEIMDPYIATLSAIEPAKEAAYRVTGSQLAAMPVVGLNKKLIGAVTIDAAIMEISLTNASETLRIFS